MFSAGKIYTFFTDIESFKGKFESAAEFNGALILNITDLEGHLHKIPFSKISRWTEKETNGQETKVG